VLVCVCVTSVLWLLRQRLKGREERRERGEDPTREPSFVPTLSLPFSLPPYLSFCSSFISLWMIMIDDVYAIETGKDRKEREKREGEREAKGNRMIASSWLRPPHSHMETLSLSSLLPLLSLSLTHTHTHIHTHTLTHTLTHTHTAGHGSHQQTLFLVG